MEKYKSEEWLSEKIDDDIPITDIAEECGVALYTIQYWAGKFGLIDRFTEDVFYNDEEWLREKYIGEGLSKEEIAELTPVGKQSIEQRIVYYGLLADDEPKSIRLSKAQIGGDSKHLDAKWLQEQYVERGKTDAEIAQMDDVNVGRSSVCRLRHTFGIDSDYHIAENPDSGYNYGPHWQNISKRIRKRDNYKCQNCGISQRKYKNMFDMALDVHHKTPVSEFNNLAQANRDENLVTLCRACHKKIE